MRRNYKSEENMGSGATEAVTREKPRVPDGGWGWLVVVGGLITFLLWSGFLKAMGVLLPRLTVGLTHNTALTGEVAAMMAGVRSLAGPLAGPIGDRFGYRPVVMVMSLIAACGIISASFAQTTIQFLTCLSVISGVGFSAPIILTKAMIGRYFDHRFALAMSLASAGDSLSMIIIAPMAQVLLDTYGWRGALLLYGGLCLHIIAAGALLRNPPSSDEDKYGYTSIPSAGEITDPTKATDQAPARSKSLLETFNLSIFTKFVFWMIGLVMLGTYLIGISWYLYFIPHAKAKGFDSSQAVTFVAAAGVGQIITKIVLGKLIDQRVVSVRFGLVLCITLCSLALAIDPFLNTFWPMMIVTIIFGSFFGLVYCLVDVLAKEIAGEDGLASAFGYIDLVGGIARIFLGSVPGWIYERTGSYDIAFVVLGGLYLIVLMPVIAEWIIHRRKVLSNEKHSDKS